MTTKKKQAGARPAQRDTSVWLPENIVQRPVWVTPDGLKFEDDGEARAHVAYQAILEWAQQYAIGGMDPDELAHAVFQGRDACLRVLSAVND